MAHGGGGTPSARAAVLVQDPSYTVLWPMQGHAVALRDPLILVGLALPHEQMGHGSQRQLRRNLLELFGTRGSKGWWLGPLQASSSPMNVLPQPQHNPPQRMRLESLVP